MARTGWGQGPIPIGGAGGGGLPRPPWAGGNFPMSGIRGILIGLAVLILLVTGYYQVDPQEVGVVQRLGRFVRTADPGPHFKIPFGIETVIKVPVQSQLKMEFGFHTIQSDVQSSFGRTPEE